jgi:hypothetical protein
LGWRISAALETAAWLALIQTCRKRVGKVSFHGRASFKFLAASCKPSRLLPQETRPRFYNHSIFTYLVLLSFAEEALLSGRVV